jgi:hypothetical protein
VAVGDFNGDGKKDVVTANESGVGVTLLLGKGTGGFLPRKNFAVGKAPSDILAADVNGDGRLDIVTANKGNDKITVLRGNGNGTFKPAQTYSVGTDPAEVAIGDFNADGRKDLAVANTGSGTVSLLFGAVNGGFTSGGTVTVGTAPSSVAIGDFNGDGKHDLASVTGGFGHLDINLNLGNGTFGTKVNFETGFVATSVAVGHFNNDQIADLAVAHGFPSGDGISILIGNGDGTFQDFTSFDAGDQNPKRLAIADLDGDGAQDIVTANGVLEPDSSFGNNSVSVLMGNGAGSFGEARVYMAGQGPVDVAVADFNSDGVLDVVTADHDGDVGTVSLLRGHGNGTFSATPNLVTREGGPFAAADVDGDGVQDIVALGSDKARIFIGNGNGTFQDSLLTTITGASSLSSGVAVADVNKDQHPDLVVTIPDLGVPAQSRVAVLLGNGDGTFQAQTDFVVGPGPKWVLVDEFNGDGNPDLALAMANSSGVSILLGNGDGTFDAPVSVQAGGEAKHISSGDFNGDGKRDLIAVHDATSNDFVSVVHGVGNGTFGTPKNYGTNVGPGAVGVGDFTGNGRSDFAIPTFFGSAVAVFSGGANGSMVKGPVYEADSRPVSAVVADLTGDGKADLAVVNNFSDNVFLFPGRGDGTFGAAKKFVVGSRPDWIAAADFNGDGKKDLAVVNSISGTISLLMTPAPAAAFRVTTVPTTTTAGAAFKVVVSARDADGRIVTNFNGTVNFSSSDPKAVLPLAYKFTAADRGEKVFIVTLKTAGTRSIVVTGGALSGSDTIDVVPAAAKSFAVIAPPTSIPGVPFNLNVTARDKYGNVATGYRGTVKFTSSDKSVGVFLPPNYTFVEADNGVHTFSVTLVKPGKQTVTVKDVVKPTILFRTVNVQVG